MFNIIEHGNTFPYICTCAKCGCVWVFDNEELIYTGNSSYDYYQARCPECYTKTNKWKKEDFKRGK